MKAFWLRRSIARRLIFTLLIACILVWAAIYVMGQFQVRQSESGNFDREMFTLSEAVRASVEAHPAPPQTLIALTGVDAWIDSDARVNDVPRKFFAFTVTALDGTLVARSRYAQDQPLGRAEQTGFFNARFGGEVFRVHAALSRDGKHRIEVTQSEASRQQVFDTVMFSLEGILQPLLIGFPILLAMVLFALYSGLQPLRRLRRELSMRKPGDLNPISVSHVYAELTPMVRELNATLARLRELLERERNFLADAAHELRTPLALITAQADTLIHAQEPQARTEAARRLHSGIARCARLVNQLLALVRLEADVEDHPNRIDIGNVVRDSLSAHAAEAHARHVELAYAGPDSLVAILPGNALASVLDNLVGNAVRYVNEGGRVEVRLETQNANELHLQVRDDGPGIDVQQRERMFERFRRGTGLKASGSGLGLAIVAAAARQMNAKVQVTDGLDGRGVCIALTWNLLTE
jgi:two-component system, OmpR family, sensor histidine kinase QseC